MVKLLLPKMIMHFKVNNLLWWAGPSQQPSTRAAARSIPFVLPQVTLRAFGGVLCGVEVSGFFLPLLVP